MNKKQWKKPQCRLLDAAALAQGEIKAAIKQLAKLDQQELAA